MALVNLANSLHNLQLENPAPLPPSQGQTMDEEGLAERRAQGRQAAAFTQAAHGNQQFGNADADNSPLAFQDGGGDVPDSPEQQRFGELGPTHSSRVTQGCFNNDASRVLFSNTRGPRDDDDETI